MVILCNASCNWSKMSRDRVNETSSLPWILEECTIWIVNSNKSRRNHTVLDFLGQF